MNEKEIFSETLKIRVSNCKEIHKLKFLVDFTSPLITYKNVIVVYNISEKKFNVLNIPEFDNDFIEIQTYLVKRTLARVFTKFKMEEQKKEVIKNVIHKYGSNKKHINSKKTKSRRCRK